MRYRRDLGDKVQVLATYPFRKDNYFAFSKRSKCASVLLDKVGVELEKANKVNQYFLLLNKYRRIFNETQSTPPTRPRKEHISKAFYKREGRMIESSALLHFKTINEI